MIAVEIGIGIWLGIIGLWLTINHGGHKKRMPPPPKVDPMFDFDILEEESKWR